MFPGRRTFSTGSDSRKRNGMGVRSDMSSINALSQRLIRKGCFKSRLIYSPCYLGMKLSF